MPRARGIDIGEFVEILWEEIDELRASERALDKRRLERIRPYASWLEDLTSRLRKRGSPLIRKVIS